MAQRFAFIVKNRFVVPSATRNRIVRQKYLCKISSTNLSLYLKYYFLIFLHSISASVAGIYINNQHPENYRIYSHNLRTFFPSLAAEKSGCVKYADFFVVVLIWVLF
jgi:hypothetical protein